jgi:hypothetical protein
LLRRSIQLTAAIALVSLLATLAFALGTLRQRPLENTEGCLLFEAARIREGLALYTNPIAGAFDYGAVPVRAYVLYPPLWAFLLSLVPKGAAVWAGRSVSLLAWYGSLGWIGWGAYVRRRPWGALAVVFFSGVYSLALYGGSARPDALAVAFAAVVLERTVRANRDPSPLALAAYTLAAFLKPNVIGLGLGAVLFLLSAPKRAVRALLGSLSVAAVLITALVMASHGGVWIHLSRSTLQAWSLSLWLEQLSSRSPLFALPIGWALAVGNRSSFGTVTERAGEAKGLRLAVLSLETSVVWTLLSLGKVGSSTCYWMEPCVAACIVLAHAPIPPLSLRWQRVILFLLPVQALWSGVASVRSSLEAIALSSERAPVLEKLREHVRPDRLLLSDDAGLEFMLDDRLVDTPFQTTHLVKEGRFDRLLWTSDVLRPEIAGVVTSDDILERPLSDVDPEHDRYDPEMRRVLRERFVLAEREGGLYVYRRR